MSMNHHPDNPDRYSIALSGLDGSNLLAFLAALGTLRTLSRALDDMSIQLHWEARGMWTPVLSGPFPNDDQEAMDLILFSLHTQLQNMAGHPVLTVANNLNMSPRQFRQVATAAVQLAHQSGDRTGVDFVAAFGCDAISEDDVISDTAFRTMSGAGHQHFLKTMHDLVALTEPEHLKRSLFEPWDYADDRPSLRWDPADDRRYALRWNEPSGDPIRTMRGANRLAVEALPLFPTAPVGNKLETTGFRTGGSRNTFFSWPIWETPISIDVVRSLLALPELQLDAPPRDKLRPMGIVDVLRSQRLTIGKFRNFAPSQSI